MCRDFSIFILCPALAYAHYIKSKMPLNDYISSQHSQLNLVRESNAHLRRENEELSKRISVFTEELKNLKDSAMPLEEAGRKLKAEKEALEGVNAQLLLDANYWRDRWAACISSDADLYMRMRMIVMMMMIIVTIILIIMLIAFMMRMISI